jgi:feruloyl esterase
MRIRWIFLFGAMAAHAHAHADPCADLKSLHPQNTTLTASELVPEAADGGINGAPPQTVPEHCKVTGTIAPSIEFELWLPVKNWNGNWQAVGTGGFGGTINTMSMAVALRAGYATAANNSGHHQDDVSWMSSRQRVRLWGHESIHLMVPPVETLIQRFYGKPHQKAYFSGCSTGGDQAMEEAQYYPEDFDGIVAISPGMAYSHLMLSFLWSKKVSEQYPDSKLSAAKLQLLHRTALAHCDKLNGVEDGLLEDPRDCDFDVATLKCPGPDGPDCLTAHQIETVRQLMAGPHNPRTGAEIYPGFYFGSEASPEYADTADLNRFGWTLIQGPLADRYAIPLLATMVFADSHWDPTRFDFDTGVRQVDAALEGVITAMDPDLRPYARHGGKLIMIQGWSDPLNPPTLPIEYWEKVNKVFASAAGGRKAVEDFYRLFMAPGMGHCALGPGPNEFDAVAALDRWVTTHEPPTHLIATKHLKDDPRAAVLMTRPLCSYPAHAVWDAKGDPHSAQSFTCVPPRSH